MLSAILVKSQCAGCAMDVLVMKIQYYGQAKPSHLA
jgi:hypothetical protein